MSLRIRVTLLTMILIVAAASLLGVTVITTAQRIQIAEADKDLYAAIAQTRVRSLADNPRPSPPGVEIPIALGRVNRDGTILPLTSAGTPANPIPLPILTEMQRQEARITPITVVTELRYRVAIRPSRPGGAEVIAAMPLTNQDTVLRQLAGVIVIAALGISVIGGLAAWLLVGRSFRPVERMVTAAEAIADGDLDERVPVAAQGTELGRLSRSLNVMIATLTTSLQRVAASEKQVRDFVSDASHEIRTPLTVIRGYVELLLHDVSTLDDLNRRALERIDSESRRLDGLVTQLLALEKAQNQTSEAFQSLDLAPLVTEQLTDLQALGQERIVRWQVEPSCLLGDTDSMKQVLGNLCQNIVRHTPSDSEVSASCRPDGDTIIVQLDDAGPGIPARHRLEVLDRFHQAQAESEPKSEGFGLGMSIVAAIIESHNGTIELSDSPLGGLRVTMSFPRSPSPCQ